MANVILSNWQFLMTTGAHKSFRLAKDRVPPGAKLVRPGFGLDRVAGHIVFGGLDDAVIDFCHSSTLKIFTSPPFGKYRFAASIAASFVGNNGKGKRA